MDTTASDYIRHRLERYERSVDMTMAGLRDLHSPVCINASAPFAEQCAIPALLNSLAGHPDENTFRQDYTRITRKLEVFSRGSGPVYRARLFDELVRLVHEYHASACHAGICNLSGEAAVDPCRRRLISLLLSELRRDHDLSGIDSMLSMVDDNLSRSVTVRDDGGEGGTATSRAYNAAGKPEQGSSRDNSRQIRIG
jgi:hypothetical protein